MESLWQDLKFSARMLVRNPGFTVVAVVTLALGIGANTAIFSVVHALLFAPLPYHEPERLVAVVQPNDKPSQYGDDPYWPYPTFLAFREQSKSFTSLAAYYSANLTVMLADRAERVQAEIVTSSYFSLLGVNAVVGRVFNLEEGRPPGAHPVVLLGHDLWQQRFAGDPNVVGRTLYVKNAPFTVAGVLPPGFRGQPGTVEVWVPMMMAEQVTWRGVLSDERSRMFKVIGRLRPRVTREQARAELTVLSQRIEQTVPPPRRSGAGKEFVELMPLRDTKIDPAVKRAFLILLATVSLVLLIACANTANLLLARAVTRQKEFAVRLALGAGRGRIARQVLTESVLLSAMGACAGVVLASWGVDWLRTFKPWNMVGFWSHYARTFDYFTVRLSLPVLAFNFLLAFATGILFGLVPAWQASKPNLNEMLKESSGASATGFRPLRRLSVRSALAAAEIAVALLLLAGAGLLVKSFGRLMTVNLGFEPEGVLTMTLGAERQKLSFYRTLLERVQALPGVEAASFSATTPLTGTRYGGWTEIEGHPRDAFQDIGVTFNIVTPDYFRTFRIALEKGRVFTEQDRIGALRVAVINRAFAQRFWPGEDPLGRRLQTPFRADYPAAEEWIQVVGVTDDAKYGAVEEPNEPMIYVPAWQPILSFENLSLRAAGDPTALVAAVRREVRALDKGVPIYDVTTMRDRAAKVTSRYRYAAILMGLFAGLALVLSVVGIYGVMAYAVSARTREIGVRIALGADPAQILQLVLRDGAVLVLAGLNLGLFAAFAATRVLASQLYEVRPADPATLALVTLLLVGVAFLACYVPARRAARVNPVVALRYE